jgi:4-hydroxythreonine-4-phosphate dehydrogenase
MRDNYTGDKDRATYGEQKHAAKGGPTASAAANPLPIIGITLGDFNGIGPEVILKLAAEHSLTKLFTLVVFAHHGLLQRWRKLLNYDELPLQQAASLAQLQPGKVNVINCWNEDYELKPGTSTPQAGKAAWLSIAAATGALQAAQIQAVVTAPINKANMPADLFPYPGHTEYYAAQFGTSGGGLMLLIGPSIRVGVVTGHIPLSQVPGAITPALLEQRISALHQALQADFGIGKPKIAVLGLNPHAGEEGKLGREEIEIINPVIAQFKAKGKLVFGAYPADGFFGSMQHRKFDGVLAMYHDQGLIPFKAIAFDDGVNYTAGLSQVRTSPDHGTAYNISGQGLANPDSMRQALYLAADIVKQRAAPAL